jgi:predicted ester cyclase
MRLGPSWRTTRAFALGSSPSRFTPAAVSLVMPCPLKGFHMSDAAEVYRGFIEAVNNKDLVAAGSFVAPGRYRENCIGFTKGFVNWDQAKASILQVWKGLPDLRVELPYVIAAESGVVLAQGTVRGTANGRLYGAPATKRSFGANFFDFVRVEHGLIVERIQQADVLGRMKQLYGRAMGLVGLVRQQPFAS